jgi:hypothetical protein
MQGAYACELQAACCSCKEKPDREGTKAKRCPLFRAMTPHAVLVSKTCITSDHRTIRWWECELVDEDGARRIREQAFFSIGEARSWASSQGYPVEEASLPGGRTSRPWVPSPT